MKYFFIVAISALILSIGGVLVLNEARAQVSCTGMTETEVAATCGSGLRCIGPTGEQRCNVPPPIWNAEISGVAQDASFNVQHDSTVLGNLTVGDVVMGTGRLLTNAIFSRWGEDTTGMHRDDIWIGDTDDTAQIQGSLRVRGGNIILDVGEATVDGVNLDNVVTSITVADGSGLTLVAPGNVGHGRALSLRSCTVAGQVLQWNATTSSWACATVTGGGDGGEPLFTAWRDSTTPALTGLLQVGGFQMATGATAGRVLTSNASGVGTWQAPQPIDVSDFITAPDGCDVGQILQWNGEAWICANDAVGAGGGVGGGVNGTGVANKLAFWTGANTLGQNINLHWNNALGRLGIGMASPEFTLDVSGDRMMIRNPGGNAELDLRSMDPDLPDGVVPQHWGLFVERNSRDLRFWYDTERFFFSSAGDFVAMNSVNANGCFGPVFVGTTAAPGSQGSVGGYIGANALCNGRFLGSHVCLTEEILGSIRCGSTAVLDATGFAWISNGPPAFTAPANDCRGWTNNTAAVFGAMWEFGASGGQGHLTGCNTTRVFACCR